jgi:poly-gamma-glutamate synthase PgsB/CapB
VTLALGLGLLALALIGLGIAEHTAHARKLAAIPIRIHVNGTRGKSSIVRLIAAALRAHGIQVYAKTTGSLPRVITTDGSELPLHRPGLTNVIEQRRIIGIAAEEGAEAIVLECMALQPALQSLCELKMIRSTHGVISNARPDHLDVMGPAERDVALALLGTCPIGGTLFTAELEHLPLFEAACADRGSRLVALGPEEANAVSDEEMQRFSYIEHKENVALALALARSLGIPRDVALEGMLRAQPDVGALREYELEFFGRDVVFANGFAANDPVSTERIWNLTLARHPQARTRIMVLNCRLDRPDRSNQLGEALPSWAPAHHYLLMGTGTHALARTAVAAGLRPTLLTPLEGESPPAVFEAIMGACSNSSLVMGAGNIAGSGLELLKLFQNRARLPETGEARAA